MYYAQEILGRSILLIPCAQLTGMTKLTFLDGSEVRVKGLDDIFAAAYANKLPAELETAELMVDRLEQENYIPSTARKEYRSAVLKEYRAYIAEQVKQVAK